LSNIIIKTLFKVSGLHVFTFPESPLSQKQAHQIITICRELKKRKPLQYILGETCFYNCILKVNGSTLIPRPETEELVELIIKENREFRGSILDLGTGSGCIAIALSVNLPGTRVAGIDISEGAVTLARENAVLNKSSAIFYKADINNFDSIDFQNTGIIVSNPPYVRESEKKHMEKNVLDFEPHAALFVPDADPLLFYRSILKAADEIHVPGGRLYFEINEVMGQEMTHLLEKNNYSKIEVIKDLNGRDRIIKGTRNG
jgi:release factor glutamine methyltransferase